MARSLVGGLVANGFDRSSIAVSDPSEAARLHVSENFHVQVEESNQPVISASSTVVLAVKPQVMAAVLKDSESDLQTSRPLLVSIAAGIRLCDLEAWSGGGLPIVRVMPNTPALIRKGVSAMYANPRVSEEEKKRVETILSAVGNTVWLSEEGLLDAVTAVSGSGPAYFFYLIEAIEQAANDLGLNSETSHTLATETAVGAALLSLSSSESPSTLRRQVTSPGGVTEAALNLLEAQGVKQSIVEAIKAGESRAVEMSQPGNTD